MLMPSIFGENLFDDFLMIISVRYRQGTAQSREKTVRQKSRTCDENRYQRKRQWI